MPIDDNLTSEQFETILNEAAKGMTPAEVKPASIAAQLTRHKKVLQKFRAKGFNCTQISTMLETSKLKVEVSPSLLRKVLAVRRPASKPVSNDAPTSDTVKYQAVLPNRLAPKPAAATPGAPTKS